MQKRTVAVCEDVPEDYDRLQGCLLESAEAFGLRLDISRFENAEDLLSIFRARAYDVVFLDIYLGGMSGVLAARRLLERDPDCLIVFITGSAEFALEGHEIGSLHYLLKPLTSRALLDVWRRAERQVPSFLPGITLVVDRKERTVKHRDILYVEACNKLCRVQTPEGALYSRVGIDQLERALPSPPFYRCHRSFIVNFDHVSSVERDFVMDDGAIVSIRQVDLKRIREAFFRYLIDKTRLRAP